MYRKKVTLENKYGFNTRIAGMLAQKSHAYQSDIIMEYEGKRAYTREILRMLSLHPEEGAEVLFIADGVDEVQAVESACALIKDYAENEKREKAEREARKAKRKETLLRFLPFLRK